MLELVLDESGNPHGSGFCDTGNVVHFDIFGSCFLDIVEHVKFRVVFWAVPAGCDGLFEVESPVFHFGHDVHGSKVIVMKPFVVKCSKFVNGTYTIDDFDFWAFDE